VGNPQYRHTVAEHFEMDNSISYLTCSGSMFSPVLCQMDTTLVSETPLKLTCQCHGNSYTGTLEVELKLISVYCQRAGEVSTNSIHHSEFLLGALLWQS
jgi:hypothetical protein